MQQFIMNILGWNSVGEMLTYPQTDNLGKPIPMVDHSIMPDKHYTFNEVFVDNIKNSLHTRKQ